MDLTLLTPLGALIAVVVVVPLVALSFLHRRGTSVRQAIGLPEPRRRVIRAAVAALVVAAALLGLAAAQPRLEWTSDKRVRNDAEAIVVIDTSRSMLARTSPRSQIRYARATAAGPYRSIHQIGTCLPCCLNHAERCFSGKYCVLPFASAATSTTSAPSRRPASGGMFENVRFTR